jgi:hypothetical protein
MPFRHRGRDVSRAVASSHSPSNASGHRSESLTRKQTINGKERPNAEPLRLGSRH